MVTTTIDQRTLNALNEILIMHEFAIVDTRRLVIDTMNLIVDVYP